MKQSCLFLIVLWIASGIGYYILFNESPLDEVKYWLPIVLGLLWVLVVANFQGIWLALRQKSAAGKSISGARDGDYIGVSGNIRASEKPLIAPFSGEEAVIVEYEVKREQASQSSDGGTTTKMDFQGMLMTPCAISGRTGSARVVGFPLLAHIQAKRVTDELAYVRAAKYLAAAPFKELSSNPLTIMKELNAVLKDDDGTVQADFRDKSLVIPEQEDFHSDIEQAGDELGDPENVSDLDEDEHEWSEQVQKEQAMLSTPQEKQLLSFLRNRFYKLYETTVKNGETVTVFGTFQSKPSPAINIGSGLKMLRHQIHRGRLEDVIGSQIRKSVIAFVIFLLITLGANYAVAFKLGIDLPKLFEEIKGRVLELVDQGQSSETPDEKTTD
ncbi:MAG: hypothetical protein KDD64_03215 [Bdellovibrionales bacterium]|nr:hypothetical protein [Bdellovibrionales bacterium]